MRLSRAAKRIDLMVFLQSPPPTRWVPSKKASVVLAVRAELISLSAACDRYRLSLDEFANWEAAFDDQGIVGLHQKRRIRKTSKPAIRATTGVSRELRWQQYRE
jgi:hypothetical protein